MFSDFDDKKHLLAGLKENRNVRPVAGIALPGLEMQYVSTALRSIQNELKH